MAYIPFSSGYPTASQAPGAWATGMRANFAAIRDAVTVGGMVGWDLFTSGATPSQPDNTYMSDGTQTLKINVTWATSGAGAGSPSVLVYYYRATATAAYSTMGTLGITYATDGSVTTATWS